MSQDRLMLADVVCECARLREALELERAGRRTAEGYVAQRGAVIRQLEEAVEILKTRCAELVAEVAAVRAQPCPVEPEKELYRQALAEIEGVLHRLGNGCAFTHVNATGTEETEHVQR